MKDTTTHCPPGLTRDQWIGYITATYPELSTLLDYEAALFGDSLPVVVVHYEQEREAWRHLEWEKAT